MRSTVTSLRKLTTTERITEAGPLTITQEVAQELNIDHSTVVQHLKQIRKVKKLDKWVQHELIPNQKKKKSFWSVTFLYSTQQHWTISQSDCDLWWKLDFIWHPAMTSSVAGLRRNSKALPKAKVALKKVMVTVWGSGNHLITTDFWILMKPLHLKSMFSKSMRYTKNCIPCSQYWSTERAQFLSMTSAPHISHNRTWCTGKTQRDGAEREWEGESGWGIHVNPWLIHVNVWQKPLQYCKVISLQLIKINK